MTRHDRAGKRIPPVIARPFAVFALTASLCALPGCAIVPETTSTTTTTVTDAQTGSTTTTVTTTVAPPALPVYEQPVAPGPGYLWTPGYWAWSISDYYWVPGVWVLPPRVGLLWTPGWWGWSNGVYRWNAGYWGPSIGFYGGINYGFGYFGFGYVGGYWNAGQFYYNRSVNNVHNTSITNVYVDNSVTRNTTIVNRVSYNGGSGGVQVAPTPAQSAERQRVHEAPTAQQVQQHDMAIRSPGQRFSHSGAEPAVFGTSRVVEQFADPGAVRTPGRAVVPLAAPTRPAPSMAAEMTPARPAPAAEATPTRVAPALAAEPVPAMRGPALGTPGATEGAPRTFPQAPARATESTSSDRIEQADAVPTQPRAASTTQRTVRKPHPQVRPQNRSRPVQRARPKKRGDSEERR